MTPKNKADKAISAVSQAHPLDLIEEFERFRKKQGLSLEEFKENLDAVFGRALSSCIIDSLKSRALPGKTGDSGREKGA